MDQEPLFFDYAKISDTIMYLDATHPVRFNVNLMTKDRKEGRVLTFHNEFKYYNNQLGRDVYSMKRNFMFGISIDDYENYNNSIFIRVKDIIPIQIVFENQILPWFIGDTRVFDITNDNKLIVKGKHTVQIPLDEMRYMQFTPTVVNFTEGDQKEGLLLQINSPDNSPIELTVDKFMEFYYYLTRTDFYNTASNMMTYVKTGPHGVKLVDLREENKPNYFDKQ